MATIVVCNECGRTLDGRERVTVELRSKSFTKADVVDELDCCAGCETEMRARFVSSPGLDRLHVTELRGNER